MESKQNNPATPEQIEEYKKLKLRNEWMKLNAKRLDEIERNKTFFERLSIILQLVILVVLLINLLL